jgi:hypothetical protein
MELQTTDYILFSCRDRICRCLVFFVYPLSSNVLSIENINSEYIHISYCQNFDNKNDRKENLLTEKYQTAKILMKFD